MNIFFYFIHLFVKLVNFCNPAFEFVRTEPEIWIFGSGVNETVFLLRSGYQRRVVYPVVDNDGAAILRNANVQRLVYVLSTSHGTWRIFGFRTVCIGSNRDWKSRGYFVREIIPV